MTDVEGVERTGVDAMDSARAWYVGVPISECVCALSFPVLHLPLCSLFAHRSSHGHALSYHEIHTL